MSEDNEISASSAELPALWSPPDEMAAAIHDGKIVMLNNPSDNKRQLISSALEATISATHPQPETLVLNAVLLEVAATEADPASEG